MIQRVSRFGIPWEQPRGFLLLCGSQPSAKHSYGAGRPVCVVEVEARACPLRQLLWGCFSIYRTSSMPAFGLGCCDCCHGLLVEYPIIFWTADLRVTVSTRIVLVMTLHTRCAVASPDPSRGRGGSGRLQSD